MVENKFLRFLINIPVSIVAFIIFAMLSPENGFLAFAFLFSVLIWFLFTVQKELIGFPDSKIMALLKNIFIIAMIAMSFLSLIIGVALFFSNQGYEENQKTIIDSVIVIAPAITFWLALFFSDTDPTGLAKFTYLGTPAVALVSLVISLLVGIVDIVQTIAVIVFAVGSIPVMIFAFKKRWIEFESGYTPSKPYNYSYSYSSSNDNKTSSTPTPSSAMQSIASKWSGSCPLDGGARFTYTISCTISGGAANFKISGNVFFSGINVTSSDVRDAQNSLQRELKFIANNRIIPSYQEKVKELVAKGVDCSSIASVRVSTGNITTN